MQAADEWVTVFGFQPSQLQTIMREFSRCGDIRNFGSFREEFVNWVHIQYAVSLLTSDPMLLLWLWPGYAVSRILGRAPLPMVQLLMPFAHTHHIAFQEMIP